MTGTRSSIGTGNQVPAGSVQTLAWRDGALDLIDQRVLPLQFSTVRCHSAAAVADAIRSMVVRGAPAIGCAAAFGIARCRDGFASASGEAPSGLASAERATSCVKRGNRGRSQQIFAGALDCWTDVQQLRMLLLSPT